MLDAKVVAQARYMLGFHSIVHRSGEGMNMDEVGIEGRNEGIGSDRSKARATKEEPMIRSSIK